MRFPSFVLVVALLLGGTATVASAQWLAQDKADYAPGETVTLTGTSFAPGENVVLQVHHADATPDSGGADHEPWTVVADEIGGFVTTWHVCEDDCVGQSLVANADGQTSGLHAETAFMDSGPLSNTPRPDVPVTEGEVRAFLQLGNTIYIGGNFLSVGPYTGVGVPLDASSGAPVAGFPKVSGSVRVVASDGSGGWYIGGSFTNVGGVTRNRVAHIDASNNVTAWNPNANNEVRALVVSGGIVYAGGLFNGASSIGGAARNRIAALDATTGLASSWNPNPNNFVNALAVSGSTVYVGGEFVFIGGQTRGAIAALDVTTGLATSWNPGANFQVRTLALSGSIIYAGGDFATIGGQTRHRLAALDVTTGLATSWNPHANGSVNSVAVGGSTVYAGGSFSSIGVQKRHRLAAFDATTGAILAWDPSANAEVRSLVASPSGSTIYVGGAFNHAIPGSGGISIGGAARASLAALDATTGLATSWNPNGVAGGGLVRTVAISGDGNTVYVGGDFSLFGANLRLNAAAADATTGAITSWNPSADNFVNTLVVSGSTVYAGGAFTTIGGQTRNRIAALNTTTGAATSWNPNANNRVEALLLSGSTLYAGGWFSNIGGGARNAIAALDAPTGLATAWNPDVSHQVLTLAVSGSMVYAGGTFVTVGGQSRPRIAEIDAATGLPTAWIPSPSHEVRKVAVSGSTVYAGGLFLSIGGEARSNFAGFAPTVVCTPPAITSAPASATVCAGGSVTFSVSTTGTEPLSYQWRKGGIDIGGAMGSSYTIASVAVGDAGSYDVVVSNGCGSATSTAATLAVNFAARDLERTRSGDSVRRGVGDVLGRGHRERAAQLPVAQGRHRHRRRHGQQLHDRLGSGWGCRFL